MITNGLISWWVDVMWSLYGVFTVLATALALGCLTLLTFNTLRLVLLRVFETAAIVEAAREAKAQGRAPLLRAWARMDAKWRSRDGR